MNPVTSLSMVYLRAFARENATRPGMVRVSRKAMHLLRMHWSVCATMRPQGSEMAVGGPEPAPTQDSVSKRPEGISGRQTVIAQGGHQ